MVQFYRHLAQESGLAVAEALRRSLLDAIDAAPSVAFRHPRFWAPVIVIGDGGATVDSAPSPSNIVSNVEISEAGGEILAAARDRKHSCSLECVRTTMAGSNGQQKTLDWARGASYVPAPGSSLPAANGTASQRRFCEGSTEPARFYGVPPSNSALPARSFPRLRRFRTAGCWLLRPRLLEGRKANNWTSSVLTVEGKRLRAGRSSFPTRKSKPFRDSASLSDGAAVVAVNLPARHDLQASGRNDFGYAAVCIRSPGAYLYKLDLEGLAPRATAFLPGIRTDGLTSGSALLYAGSAHKACDPIAEQATFGHVNPDLSAAELWHNGGGFSTSLKAIFKTAGSYAGVGNVTEALFDRDAKLNDGGHVDWSSLSFKKRFEFQKDRLVEIMILNFDADGHVVDKKFVGTALPSSAAGMMPTGRGYMAYGSAGFNPWIVSIQPDK